MKGYDCLLTLAGRLLSARYPERRAEIVATARAAGRDGNRRSQLAEVTSLVALALRPARPSASPRTVWLHGAVLAGALAVLAAATPLALALPFILLVLGGLDARLAAAATLFWLFRLTTADAADVIGSLGEISLTAQALRWLLMLVGLGIAAHVTRVSMRRAASL